MELPGRHDSAESWLKGKGVRGASARAAEGRRAGYGEGGAGRGARVPGHPGREVRDEPAELLRPRGSELRGRRQNPV